MLKPDKNLEYSELFPLILEHGNLAIFVFRVVERIVAGVKVNDYQFLYTNHTHQVLTGISLEEIQNKYLMELSDIVPGDQLRKIKQNYDLCVKTMEVVEYEEEIEIKNKKTYWYTKLTPIVNNGKVLLVIGASVDISRSKKIEEQEREKNELLKTLLQVSPFGVAITDENFHIVYYNDEFLHLWELQEENITSDRRVFIHMLRSIKNRKKVYPKIMQLVRKRVIGSVENIKLKNKIMKMTIAPIQTQNKFIGYLGIYEDITKDYKNKKKLKKLVLQLQLANRSKNEFIANISHEIRTPLTSILGLTEILKSIIKEPQAMKYLSIIENSSLLLLGIIQDLLDISSIELGTIKIEKEPFLLNKCIDTLIQTYKVHCEKKGLAFVYKTDMEKNVYLVGDEKRLYQILNNLLSNALKFTKYGKIELRVMRVQETEDSVTILFSVEDTGSGIPKDKIHEIFEKFKKLNDYQNNYQGIGIGLAIVKALVELMEGEIRVKSQPGKGSVFEVEIPFGKFQGPVMDNIEEMSVEEIIRNFKIYFLNKRILIAEDVFEIQLLIKKYLENTGLEYDIVSNGIEALDMLRRKQYDAILLDIKMPLMGGLETYKNISSQIKATTPIAALTAFGSKEDIQKTKEMGFVSHITKPIKRKDFLIKILELLQLRESLSKNQGIFN